MKKLKRFFIVILFIATAFFIYVEVVNRNSVNMTYRQKVLKAVYPAIMWLGKITGKNSKKIMSNKQPTVSFYTLKGTLNDGSTLDFATLKGKKVMLVNTASECGYTGQYESLQTLSEQYKNKLIVIGFPANDFKEQEKGTDEQIAAFCKKNYGVSFPLMKKSIVVKSPQQNDVYKWLTEEIQNGWNNTVPSWNFSKYIVNEKGELTNYFESSISPLSREVTDALK